MNAAEPIWALGLMSGTSMDGIDAAIVETDGERIVTFGPSSTTPYDPSLREAIRAALGPDNPPAGLARDIADAHAAAATALLSLHSEFRNKIRLVGLHGHTLFHAPAEGLTRQAGDAARLADSLGIDVVGDFRSADVSAGGQGAPLAPLYHRALVRATGAIEAASAVLNIGGISNVTWIGPGDEDLVAFDTGPGNALLDDWVSQRSDLECDRDGQVSARGTVDAAVLAVLLADPYYAAPPPKSLDRLDFDVSATEGLSLENGAATLVALTVESLAGQLEKLPSPPNRVLVTGGGRHNPNIMLGLRARLGVPVEPVEAAGWDGDVLEAQAFAYLAVRSLRGLALSLPTTTGVPNPTTGGVLHRVGAA
ncbi:MAG: anhydro-N-acetylmuramic acid kinase [Alphaproteobacteria bacterium]